MAGMLSDTEARTTDIRTRSRQVIAAIEQMVECEDATRAMEQDFDALAERIWQEPVRSWDDIAVRAEIARHYADTDPWGGLRGLDSDDLGERSAARLIDAILKFAR